MSRRTRHSLPTAKLLLQPKVVDGVAHLLKFKRQKSKFYYDRNAKELPKLNIGQNVRMKSAPNDQNWKLGTCVGKARGGRSYIIEADNRI